MKELPESKLVVHTWPSMIEKLKIASPKRGRGERLGFEGYYPYYAGFSESFAAAIIDTASLRSGDVVFDPWNGSGTTLSVATYSGFPSIGFDLNPVMVTVSKARLLPSSEAVSLRPLGKEIVGQAQEQISELDESDPLLVWFTRDTAAILRAIERTVARLLVPTPVYSGDIGENISSISCIAATFYVALFSLCRKISEKFRSSNPTWFRYPKEPAERISLNNSDIEALFLCNLSVIRQALTERKVLSDSAKSVVSEVRWADTTLTRVERPVDFVLTSPPYCTRLDYTATTRVELALMHALVPIKPNELSRRMMGTTRVPKRHIEQSSKWGARCIDFLSALSAHPSKASSTYYLTTHIDYFDKLFVSLERISAALKNGGTAVFVVQDSFYKELHNDVPGVLSDMAHVHGLELRRRVDFASRNELSQINPKSRAYHRPRSTESVLCFSK